MLEGKIIKMFFIIVMIVFNLCLCSLVFSKDCGDPDNDSKAQMPTAPGNTEYPQGWHCTCDPYIPISFNPNNPKEIDPDTSIEIAILDGCPPFIWKNPGNGYSWANGQDVPNDAGSKQSNSRSNQLQCSDGT